MWAVYIISAAPGHLRASSHGSHLHEISEFVYAIPSKCLVDIEDFCEICDGIVHECGFSAMSHNTKLLIISEMNNFSKIFINKLIQLTGIHNNSH